MNRDDDEGRLVRDLSYEVHAEQLQPSLTGLTVMKETIERALTMAASFSYSMEVPVLLSMIGNLKDEKGDNTNYLAAATLIVTLFDTAVNLTVMTSFAMMFIGGNIYGEINNDGTDDQQKIILKNRMSRMLKNSLGLSAPFTVICVLFLYFSKPILVDLFGQNEEVCQLAEQFLLPAAFLMPLFMLRFNHQHIIYIHKKQKWLTAIGLTGFSFFGIFLAHVLGYGDFSSSPMKILGIFFGVMAENIFTTFLTAALFLLEEFKDYRFLASSLHCDHEDGDQFFELAKQGLPLEATYLSELSTVFLKNMLAGRLGKNELAAQNFASQVIFINLIFAHAFSQAVSYNVSGAQRSNKSLYARYGLLTAVLFGAVVGLVVSVHPKMLTTVFSDGVNNEVISLSNTLVPLAGAGSVLYVGALTMLQSIRTMTPNHLKSTIFFNLWLWGSVLAGYLFSMQMGLGAVGIGVASLLGTFWAAAHVFRDWRRVFGRVGEEKPLLNIQQDSSASLLRAPSARVSSSRFSWVNSLVDRFWSRGDSSSMRVRLVWDDTPSAHVTVIL